MFVKLDVGGWNRWLECLAHIKRDLGTTVADRATYTKFMEVVAPNAEWISENNGVMFIDFVRRSYVARAVLGVRRQMKTKGEVASLRKLACQIMICADQLTFEFYVARRGGDTGTLARAFRSFSEDGERVSPGIIESHIDMMDGLSLKIVTLADRAIAHTDVRGVSDLPTYGEIDEAIKGFEALAQKYILFLTGEWHEMEPVVPFDWMKVFRHPFIDPRK